MDNQHYRYCFSCEKWKTKSEINEVDWGDKKSYCCNVCRKDLGENIQIFHCHHHPEIIMKVWGTLENENKEKIFYAECPKEKKQESQPQSPDEINWKTVTFFGIFMVGVVLILWIYFYWTNKKK